MSRARTLFSVVIPSMLAGGLLFGSAFTHADVGPDAGLGFWPAGATVAQAPTPPHPPTPPTPPPATPAKPPATPAPPKPPAPPAHHGVSVNIKDGKVDISGVDEMVNEQIDNAKKSIEQAPLSADVKAKLLARLDKTKAIVKKRLKDTKNLSPEQMGEEMEKMGEEIGAEMEAFGKEMEKFGDMMDKQWGGSGVHVHSHGGDDDDDDDSTGTPMAPDVSVDTDDEDIKDAIKDLGDLALKPAQRDAITKLRKDSDKTVADAKKQIDQLSTKLHDALGNHTITDADVAKYVDQISAQEAAIRKARLIAWVHARAVLDEAQRKKVEDAAAKKKAK